MALMNITNLVRAPANSQNDNHQYSSIKYYTTIIHGIYFPIHANGILLLKKFTELKSLYRK